MLAGDLAAARPLLEEGLAVAQETACSFATAASLKLLGDIAMFGGDQGRATALIEESLAPLSEIQPFSEIEDETDQYVATAVAHYWRAEQARYRGDFDLAIALLDEGVARARERHDSWSIGWSLAVLGRIAWLKGDFERSQALQRESLVLRSEMQDRYGITICLEGLGWVANAQGRPVAAARLFGAAAALQARIGAAAWPFWRAEHERNLDATRASLGEQVFTTAWAEGQALSLDAAIAEALGASDPPSTPVGPPAQAATGSETLSPRERQVAVLIAQGYTNQRIADELIISEWTVDTHVRHILTKLDFRSRAQVAVWATEQGLLPAAQP
jgi:non-specific serine/threonine protein kinase